MKIFILVTIVFCFVYIGYSIKLYFKNRNNFFKSLLDFVSIYKNEISFSKDSLKRILDTHRFEKDFDKFIRDFSILKIDYPKYILDNEKLEINKFLDSIGTKDIDGEIQMVNSFENKFKLVFENTTTDLVKKGGLALKLSLVLGLLLAILLI